MTAGDSHALARLGEVLAASGLPGRLEGGVWRLPERDLRLVWRTAQPWTERLLEITALHGLRTRHGDAKNTVVVIRLPHLPKGYAQVRLEQKRLVGGRHGSWIILSERGGCHVQVPPLGIDVAVPDPTSAAEAESSAGNVGEPFGSDMILTILKVLMAKEARTTRLRHWFGGRFEAIHSISDLAEEVGYSASGVYARLGELRQRGWVEIRRGEAPRIADVPSVVRWWLDTQRHVLHRPVAVVPLLSTRTKSSHGAATEFLRNAPPVPLQWAMSGWTACKLHGASALADGRQKPLQIAVDSPIAPVLRAWNLRLLKPGMESGALFSIERAQTPRSYFCGTTIIHGLPVVDLWQAALDVASDSHRGSEQAAAIAEELWLAT